MKFFKEHSLIRLNLNDKQGKGQDINCPAFPLHENRTKNKLLFDTPFYHAQRTRAWYVSGVKKRFAFFLKGALIMHSFIFNLRETDDKTTYEDYEVAGMFNRADYVEEFPKESRYYKQALEMLKKECHGEIYWGTDITTQKGKLPLRNWSKLISSDWNTKYVKDTLLKLSIKAIEDYRRKIRRKYTDTQIDEKTGFLLLTIWEKWKMSITISAICLAI